MRIYIKKKSTFNYLSSRDKKIEGRLYKGIFKKIKENDIIEFCFQNQTLLAKIEELKKYDNFYSFLISEEMHFILPGVKEIDEGLKIYNEYYPKNKNTKVIGIKFNLLN